MTIEIQTQLAAEVSGLNPVLAAWSQFKIQSAEQAEFLTSELRKVKARAKDLTAEKEKVTKPLYHAYKGAMGWFAPAEKAYAELERVMKGKLADWDREQKAAQVQALAAATEQFNAGNHEQGIQTLALAPEIAKPAGTSTRTIWKFEVTDPNAVSRELCSPDPKKIQAAIDLGAREIAGVRVFKESIVTVRGV